MALSVWFIVIVLYSYIALDKTNTLTNINSLAFVANSTSSGEIQTLIVHLLIENRAMNARLKSLYSITQISQHKKDRGRHQSKGKHLFPFHRMFNI